MVEHRKYRRLITLQGVHAGDLDHVSRPARHRRNIRRIEVRPLHRFSAAPQVHA
ncbi:hypothetical protein [Saccharopolyspora hattusasensis]|uniref:hypothetical protein n=1 Tax=Saccharopolyspora hattusasensis TaxID=1128679 RepID=UPI003D99413A